MSPVTGLLNCQDPSQNRKYCISDLRLVGYTCGCKAHRHREVDVCTLSLGIEIESIKGFHFGMLTNFSCECHPRLVAPVWGGTAQTSGLEGLLGS